MFNLNYIFIFRMKFQKQITFEKKSVYNVIQNLYRDIKSHKRV